MKDSLFFILMHAEKENECLRILYDIIDSFKSGLMIGNLTSQFFANYYLSPLDHYVLEQLKPADMFVIWTILLFF